MSSGLTKALSNEWAAKGVNVNAIAPGYIATDNTQALYDDPDRHRSILERIPAGRWGRPADLAGATVFLGLGGVRLRQRHRPAGRRRMARPVSESIVLDRLEAFGVVPVIVIENAASAASLGSALAAGGLPCAEVTLRTDAALESLRILAEDPDLLVGAGTVIRPGQVEVALDAGARFIVSPGFSPEVVGECRRAGVPVLPGVATATEIQAALEAGVDVVKFFPAEALGGVRRSRRSPRRSGRCGSCLPAGSPPSGLPQLSRGAGGARRRWVVDRAGGPPRGGRLRPDHCAGRGCRRGRP